MVATKTIVDINVILNDTKLKRVQKTQFPWSDNR